MGWFARQLDRVSWRDLHGIGTSKLVNSSFIWLALIPFLARCLQAMHALDPRVPPLPINFVSFYFAAFFFTVGAALFNFYCPAILKHAPTFGAFRAGGYSLLELKNWFHDMVPVADPDGPRDPKKIKEFMFRMSSGKEGRGYATELIEKKASYQMLSDFWSISANEEGLSQAHDWAVKEGERKHSFARRITLISYSLGFVLFGLVALFNFWVVAKAIGPSVREAFR